MAPGEAFRMLVVPPFGSAVTLLPAALAGTVGRSLHATGYDEVLRERTEPEPVLLETVALQLPAPPIIRTLMGSFGSVEGDPRHERCGERDYSVSPEYQAAIGAKNSPDVPNAMNLPLVLPNRSQ